MAEKTLEWPAENGGCGGEVARFATDDSKRVIPASDVKRMVGKTCCDGLPLMRISDIFHGNIVKYQKFA